MTELEMCCGTTCDKEAVKAEIVRQKMVINAQQNRIGELLQERDEAIANQVICASGCKDREALMRVTHECDELAAIVERVRFLVSEYHSENIACEDAMNELVLVMNHPESSALEALKAKWQAENDHCDHEYMKFGDQPHRRCYKCDKLEPQIAQEAGDEQ